MFCWTNERGLGSLDVPRRVINADMKISEHGVHQKKLQGSKGHSPCSNGKSSRGKFNYSTAEPEFVNGLKPHFDGTVLSILMVNNNVNGLQVLRDGVWYHVPTKPYTLLINLGDMTEVRTCLVAKKMFEF